MNPNSATAWNNKGYALLEPGKYDEAIKALDEAIRLDPNLSMPGTTKAMLSVGRASTMKPSRLYDEAIRLDPNYAAAWTNKGKLS